MYKDGIEEEEEVVVTKKSHRKFEFQINHVLFCTFYTMFFFCRLLVVLFFNC